MARVAYPSPWDAGIDVAQSEDTSGTSPVAASSSPLLEFRDVAFSYPGQPTQTLKGITFELDARSFTAIVGRSGCGKSTLLNIISGFLRPDEGTCRFRQEDVRGPSPDRLPIFQDDGLWPWWTVLQNVLLRARIVQHGWGNDADARERAVALLVQTGLCGDVTEYFPKQLSVGMRKRVELARALFARPDLLVADEPFASVDANTRASLLRDLRELWKSSGATFLVATHDLHDALFLAERILVMAPQAPSRIVTSVVNPFQGDGLAQRHDSAEYYRLYDGLRAWMLSDHD
jgi:ABC-type nitrate/sulfonate/bicarbonate transport system ATPase subunit